MIFWFDRIRKEVAAVEEVAAEEEEVVVPPRIPNVKGILLTTIMVINIFMINGMPLNQW